MLTDSKKLSPPVDSVESSDESQSAGRRRSWGWSVPAWLVSMLVHVAIIMFMAAYHMPEITKAISALAVTATSTDPSEALEDFALSEPMEVATPEDMAESTPSMAPVIQEPVDEIPVDFQVEALAPSINIASFSADIVSPELSAGASPTTQGLMSRSRQSKRDLLEKYGGNADTELAVAAALKWLSQHQLPDGSWTFVHGTACGNKCGNSGEAAEAKNAATGLALMAFLGAGQTHLEGDYKKAVFNGLAFLLRNMKVTDGKQPSWYLKGRGSTTGVMYSHGIASIAMCEAYGMTRDRDLRQAAQAAVDFIVYAQDPSGGGWYYSPRAGGDTSVVGWQVMALKSAAMSNLRVPTGTIKKAQNYLDAVASKEKDAFGYRKSGDRPVASAMTACGFLCKMYMGLPKEDPGLQKAVQAFVKKGPDQRDIYFNYYAAQVLKQFGGTAWEQWDKQMKALLLSTQVDSGHAEGSWFFPGARHGDVGGRHYATCMSTMMLEVYYRYMPLYGNQSEEESFKL